MDLDILLESVVIAAIFSGLVSYIISRRQGNLQYITSERKEWREKMREIASELNGASYNETLKVLTKLKVRINAFGNNKVSIDYSDDAHIWEIISELETKKPTKEILALEQKQLIDYISLLLKFDWERSKKEIRGNAYDIASWMMFLGAGMYFAVSIYTCNVNADITKSMLASMAAAFILIIVFCNGLFFAEVKTTCKILLRGAITAEAKQYNYRRLIGCYALWVLNDIVLVIIYVYVLIQVFSFIGNGESNEIRIIFLIIMYVFGLVLQYISQTINVDKEYFYVNAINKIRSNREKDKEKIIVGKTKKDEKEKKDK